MQDTITTPGLNIQMHSGTATLKLQGAWLAKTADVAEKLCADLLQKNLPKSLFIDLSHFTHFDTSGVWLLSRTIVEFKQKGYTVTLQNENQAFSTLFTYLKACHPAFDRLPVQPSFLEKHLASLGKTSWDLALSMRDLLSFLGQVTVGLFLTLLNPRRLRLTSLVSQMEHCGVNAIPIILIMSVALGLVLAYQGEEQLRRFGAEIYTINLVSISIVREVGILITAILVAGRTGSAMTAQIGIMKMNQEIDALNTLGLNPMDILIIPRVLALILIMPCLAFISDLGGLLGGGIMVVGSLNVSPQLYIYRIAEAVTTGGFWIGIIKAPLFGAIVGIVSCFEGMRVQSTAESIVLCTTRSVVEGIFLVTVADALLSIFFSKIGI